VPLLFASKQAEAFAALLDGSAEAGSDQLGTLGNLAQRLSSVPQPQPAFTAALRDQLMSQAGTALPTTAAPTAAGAASAASSSSATGTAGTTSAVSSAATSSAAAGSAVTSTVATSASSVWMPFVAFVAATGVAITGIAAGASLSLPGDPLYGVKRQIEIIQQQLAGGRADTARAQLGFAAARLNEFRALLRKNGDAPLSADLDKRLEQLLADWASNTSDGTTTLLQQLGAGQGDVAALRATLIRFTGSQARGLAAAVQQLPDTQLQSYTGSAFAYLQRVDTALGNPVQVARLLSTLGLALPSVGPSVRAAPGGSASPKPSTPASSAGIPNTTGSAGNNSPADVPTLPIPTDGRPVPRNSIPSVPVPLPTGGSTGRLGGAVGGAAGTAGGTVDNVLGGVTGNGPHLSLPTAVPVPGVGR
jgi:hypothetical protein